MAQTYSLELAGLALLPVVKPSALGSFGARYKRYRATIPLTAQNIGDTVVVAVIPTGNTFAGLELSTDTSLGTATVSIGTAATPAKYMAAQVLTATNTPAVLGLVAQLIAGPLAAQETIIVTVGTAALPASGNLLVDFSFSNPN